MQRRLELACYQTDIQIFGIAHKKSFPDIIISYWLLA